MPAIAALLLTGYLVGSPVRFTIAAGAAFPVGFGAARDLLGWRWGAMVAAMLSMTFATFIGAVAGGHPTVFVAIACLAAAGCATIALYNEDRWWIVLQAVIALLVSSNYPGTVHAALQRSAAVCLGGLCQVAIVATLAWLFPRSGARLPQGPSREKPTRRLLISHALRAAVCVGLAFIIAHALGLANSYWAPMSALLILKPGLHETQARGAARLGGTVLGGVAATAFAILMKTQPLPLIAGVALTAGCAFALQKAHYAALTCAITATVVLLLSLGNGAALANTEHRLIATALGGLIALVTARIAPHHPALAHAGTDSVGS